MIMRILWQTSVLAAIAALSQSSSMAQTARVADGSALAGKWTYRSFHNSPVPVAGKPKKAMALIFAEATFTFEITSATALKGTIDWGSGGLELQGTIRPAGAGAPLTVEIIGTGRPYTDTAGWEYDYHGHLAHTWPNGVDQVPALVGTVIRAKPHGKNSPAGYVASFVAVKQP